MLWPYRLVFILGAVGCQRGQSSAIFNGDDVVDDAWESSGDEGNNEAARPLDTGERGEASDSGTDSGDEGHLDTGMVEEDTASVDTGSDHEGTGDSGAVEGDSGLILDTGRPAATDTGTGASDTATTGLDDPEDPTGADTGTEDEASVGEDTAVDFADTGVTDLPETVDPPVLPPLDTDTGFGRDTGAGADVDVAHDRLDTAGEETIDTAAAGDDTAVLDDGSDAAMEHDGPAEGDLFVSEIMANPEAVSDLDGEWFELYNPHDRTLSLRGCRFVAADGDAFEIPADVSIGPWSRLVFGVNGSMVENGGADVDVVYDRLDFSLDNFEDEIRLINASGVLVSMVTYNRDWDREAGRSIQLDRSSHYILVAGRPSKWCLSSAEMTGGDRGTPHTANEACLISDWDEDGFTEEAGDCDDEKASVFPGAEERWDGLDNDCDGDVDDVREAGATSHLEGRGDDHLGWYSAVSSGDINGDGTMDLLAGSSLAGPDERGRVWVVDGNDVLEWDGHVADEPLAVIEGGGDYSYFGSMGTTLGDANKDGIDDLLIVGTDAYGSSAAAGVYAGSLFYGRASLEGTLTESDADVLFQSSTAGYWFVSAVSDVDVDADGHDDVLIGNYYASTGSYGDVFFFSGATLGESEMYQLDADADLRIRGASSGDYLGYSLAAADVNRDGDVEIFVSAAGATGTGMERAGCVYMLPSAVLDEGVGLSLTVTEAASFKLCASTAHARLGRNASPQLFDVNGDDLLDIVLAAPGSEFGGTESLGMVMVFINDGTFSGVASSTDAHTILTAGDSRYFGNALHHADLDGDGESELVVGAPDFDRYDDAVDFSGEVRVYRASTLAEGGTVGASDADLYIDGSGTTGFGSTLRSADFDGNGTDELIIAAPRWSGTMGRVSVFSLD